MARDELLQPAPDPEDLEAERLAAAAAGVPRVSSRSWPIRSPRCVRARSTSSSARPS